MEEDNLRYTGLDVNVISDGIEMSMEEYAKSLQSLAEIRKVVDRNEALNKEEMKLYHKMTGKIVWLANFTRLDLCYQALKMSKNNKEATISDLRDMNRILKQVHSKMKYIHIGNKED